MGATFTGVSADDQRVVLLTKSASLPHLPSETGQFTYPSSSSTPSIPPPRSKTLSPPRRSKKHSPTSHTHSSSSRTSLQHRLAEFLKNLYSTTPTLQRFALQSTYHPNAVFTNPLLVAHGTENMIKIARILPLCCQSVRVEVLDIAESMDRSSFHYREFKRGLSGSSKTTRVQSNSNTTPLMGSLIILDVRTTLTFKPWILLRPWQALFGNTFTYRAIHKVTVNDDKKVTLHEEIFSIQDVVEGVPGVGWVYDFGRVGMAEMLVSKLGSYLTRDLGEDGGRDRGVDEELGIRGDPRGKWVGSSPKPLGTKRKHREQNDSGSMKETHVDTSDRTASSRQQWATHMEALDEEQEQKAREFPPQGSNSVTDLSPRRFSPFVSPWKIVNAIVRSVSPFSFFYSPATAATSTLPAST
ncbi:hypothetical protein HK102_014014 [Quaeritorhiza haematococci]|nr:hypothetical protein HK102_014014 [Quaeritorhiza haematococci]